MSVITIKITDHQSPNPRSTYDYSTPPLIPTSPWHKESYDTFINDQLPQLLASRLPLAGYRVTETSEQTCTVAVAIRNGNGEIEVEYPDIPRPF